MLPLRDASLFCDLSLSWSRTDGTVSFGTITAPPVELFQQFAHTAHRACLDAVGKLAQAVVVGHLGIGRESFGLVGPNPGIRQRWRMTSVRSSPARMSPAGVWGYRALGTDRRHRGGLTGAQSGPGRCRGDRTVSASFFLTRVCVYWRPIPTPGRRPDSCSVALFTRAEDCERGVPGGGGRYPGQQLEPVQSSAVTYPNASSKR